jgi:hypothetical protein
LQAKTLTEQQEITKMEHKKFLLQIRPKFTKMTGMDWPEGVFTKDEEKKFEYPIILENNTALNVEISNLNRNLDHLIWEFTAGTLQVTESVKVICGTAILKDFFEDILISVVFEDELNNRYIQFMHGPIVRLVISHPIWYPRFRDKTNETDVLWLLYHLHIKTGQGFKNKPQQQ